MEHETLYSGIKSISSRITMTPTSNHVTKSYHSFNTNVTEKPETDTTFNNYEDLSRRLSQAIEHNFDENTIGYDIIIICNNNKNNLKRLHAHKFILAVSSKPFYHMLFGHMKESNANEIEMKDVSVDTMKSILTFIYTGKTDLTFDNVLHIFIAAEMYDISALYNMCKKFILLNASKLFNKTNAIIYLPQKLLLEIIKEDGLLIKESHLLDAIIIWSEAHANLIMTKDSSIFHNKYNNNDNNNNNNKKNNLNEINNDHLNTYDIEKEIEKDRSNMDINDNHENRSIKNINKEYMTYYNEFDNIFISKTKSRENRLNNKEINIYMRQLLKDIAPFIRFPTMTVNEINLIVRPLVENKIIHYSYLTEALFFHLNYKASNPMAVYRATPRTYHENGNKRKKVSFIQNVTFKNLETSP